MNLARSPTTLCSSSKPSGRTRAGSSPTWTWRTGGRRGSRSWAARAARPMLGRPALAVRPLPPSPSSICNKSGRKKFGNCTPSIGWISICLIIALMNSYDIVLNIYVLIYYDISTRVNLVIFHFILVKFLMKNRRSCVLFFIFVENSSSGKCCLRLLIG